MSPRSDPQHGFATLTHARLRAGQGDLRGAREILEELLGHKSHQRAARRLLEQLEGGSRPADRRLAALHDLLRRVAHNTEAAG